MPIYEYRCAGCGRDFDRMQKVNDPTPACPVCGATDVARKVSLSSFSLKGTGWYSTDYKSGSSGSSSSSASSESGSASSSDSSTTSSAPACCGGGCHGHAKAAASN
jgi:putative FmdB family regulatory protein